MDPIKLPFPEKKNDHNKMKIAVLNNNCLPEENRLPRIESVPNRATKKHAKKNIYSKLGYDEVPNLLGKLIMEGWIQSPTLVCK